MHTFKEVGLEVNVKDISAETLYRVVEWENVNPLSVLDVGASVNVDEIPELDSQIVTGHLIHLDSAFLDTIVAQADQDSVLSLLATESCIRNRDTEKGHSNSPNDDSIATEEL